ncbi:restriction endonuclease subunit S [Flavobacterium sp. J27]|uniref:restriction endonuclease subunit S n=1 Tax=Flavobacterium sp. J27 TaxID=2060419 RepID=UPI0010314F1C|nr:restriction endonuclease subunit S [Flavobacterium sp. J27]
MKELKEQYNLPTGWSVATIEELIDGKDGIFKDGDWIETKDQNPDGEVRLIQLADIGDGFFRNRSDRYMTKERALELNCTFLKKGDILVARMPDPLGRACVFPYTDEEKYVTVVDVAIIRTGQNGVDSRYLTHFINSPQIRKQIEKMQTGTTRKRISRGNLSTIKIPVPPLNEQIRIALKIDELFSALDNEIENLKLIQNQLNIFRQALLKHAFEGKLSEFWRSENNIKPAKELLKIIKAEKLRFYEEELNNWKVNCKHWSDLGKLNKKPTKPSKLKESLKVDKQDVSDYKVLPDNWLWTRIADVVYKVGDINHKMPKSQNYGIPYLSTGNINENGTLNFSNTKLISEEDYLELSKKIKPNLNDIIFPRYGTIGKNVLVNTDKKFLISYSCAIIKTIPHLINPKYLYLYTLSPVLKSEIEKYIVQTTQANIGISSIEKFVFPLCNLKEQEKIVSELEKALSLIDNLEKTINNSHIKSEILKKVILKMAFNGKLVSQNLEDRPITELLTKIVLEKKNRLEALRKQKKQTPKKKIKMAKSLIEIIESEFNHDEFNYDELKAKTNLPYDEIKKQLFALLEKGDKLKSFFDENVETIKYQVLK